MCLERLDSHFINVLYLWQALFRLEVSTVVGSVGLLLHPWLEGLLPHKMCIIDYVTLFSGNKVSCSKACRTTWTEGRPVLRNVSHESWDVEVCRRVSSDRSYFRYRRRGGVDVRTSRTIHEFKLSRTGWKTENCFFSSLQRKWAIIIFQACTGVSPVVSLRGMGGSGPPTYVRTPPEISANSFKSFVMYNGDPMHVYCNFYCLPAMKNRSDPSFFELAKPQGEP